MTYIRCVISQKSADLTDTSLDDEIDNFIALLPLFAMASLGVPFHV
jgi:hypothetical protein